MIIIITRSVKPGHCRHVLLVMKSGYVHQKFPFHIFFFPFVARNLLSTFLFALLVFHDNTVVLVYTRLVTN